MATADRFTWATSAIVLQRVEQTMVDVALRDVMPETTDPTNRIERKQFAQRVLQSPGEHAGAIAKAVAAIPAIASAIDANPVNPAVTDAMLRTAVQGLWNAFSVITG
jgi:hypothetical protein